MVKFLYCWWVIPSWLTFLSAKTLFVFSHHITGKQLTSNPKEKLSLEAYMTVRRSTLPSCMECVHVWYACDHAFLAQAASEDTQFNANKMAKMKTVLSPFSGGSLLLNHKSGVCLCEAAHSWQCSTQAANGHVNTTEMVFLRK